MIINIIIIIFIKACLSNTTAPLITEVEEKLREQVAVLDMVVKVLHNFITTTPDAWAPIVSQVISFVCLQL